MTEDLNPVLQGRIRRLAAAGVGKEAISAGTTQQPASQQRGGGQGRAAARVWTATAHSYLFSSWALGTKGSVLGV